MTQEEALRLAQKLWDFHRLEHPLKKSDIILILCSHDKRVAEHAAELFRAGWAPLIVVSGGISPFTSTFYNEPEAWAYARVLVEKGVPREKILVEDASTNTGENLRFTEKLLRENGVEVRSCIVVQKPNMLRRAWATVRKEWPAVAAIASGSKKITLQNCEHDHFTQEMMIHELVGDLQRLILYPGRGLMIAQEIPPAVREAYEKLWKAGYDQYPAPQA
jgi:uncharacterized SAM-binding protein YcdF (DUF218 family)